MGSCFSPGYREIYITVFSDITMDIHNVRAQDKNRLRAPWRKELNEIIFFADTPAGKAFDVVLLWLILISVAAVMLESVQSIQKSYGSLLRGIEWFFTIVFSVEYLFRIISVGRPVKYIFSFMGIVDLIAVIPTYLSIFVTGTQYFLVIRTIRLLRVFRILKLYRFLGDSQYLAASLKASRHKIAVFLSFVLAIVVIMGAAMYLIEGPEHGFRSIPESIYWAIITLTTVGYGDITPVTPLGKTLAALVMLLGYSIIAVPTGIITAELTRKKDGKDGHEKKCVKCGHDDHDGDAQYCKVCGEPLQQE